MQQIPAESTETAATIASEAERLARYMETEATTTPIREKAHEATMRAFAKKIGGMSERKT